MLAKCKFCNEKPSVITSHQKIFAKCKCGAQGPKANTQKAAIAFWNQLNGIEEDMPYISKNYLNEKWQSARFDMENVLGIYDLNAPDNIDYAKVERCKRNITDKLNAIIYELNK